MDAQQLVERLARLRQDDEPTELLRMALLLSLQFPGLEHSCDDEELVAQCHEIAMQLSANSDQHAAVAEELDSLASTDTCDFSPDHLWTLVRAIKVQNQILHMYLGPSETSI